MTFHTLIILERIPYFGGGGEIRTHGTLTSPPVFKTGAIDHSATPPYYCVISDSACFLEIKKR